MPPKKPLEEMGKDELREKLKRQKEIIREAKKKIEKSTKEGAREWFIEVYYQDKMRAEKRIEGIKSELKKRKEGSNETPPK